MTNIPNKPHRDTPLFILILTDKTLHMKGILSMLLTAFSFGLMAQGHIEIYKDPRLDRLVEKQGTPILPSTSVEIDGYRLQLFFDNDRKAVDKSRSAFLQRYPEVDTYIIYNAPNYILKAGDFRNKHEAEKLKYDLISEFPTSFVIREKIHLPRIPDQKIIGEKSAEEQN